MRDREKALKLIDLISRGPQTTPQLEERLSVKTRQFRNLVFRARKMGAQLKARQMETNEKGKLTGPYYWEVENFLDIQQNFKLCLDFETTGTLSREQKQKDPTLWNELINGEPS